MGSSSKGGAPGRIRHKALYGGPFGRSGKYAVATVPTVDKGLHSVRFMVIEPRTGAVLSLAGDQLAALAEARRLLRAAEDLAHGGHVSPIMGTQGDLWGGDEMPAAAPESPEQKPVSRRRREVFERTGGSCFYCCRPLTLTGPWEVEHQRPKAIGGADELLNLVAACVPCNRSKSDRTALEFITQREPE